MESHNSFIILVVDTERNETRMIAQWEVATSDAELYKLALPIAARVVNDVGHGGALVHIELTNA
jgi:hypothetical protein